MRKIDYIVIHCTATQPTATKQSILNYWKNVLKWKSVGYHRLIDANGIIHELAKYEQVTNGVKGFNSTTFSFSRTLNTIRIGSTVLTTSVLFYNIHPIYNASIWKTRLSNAQLQQLTTL